MTDTMQVLFTPSPDLSEFAIQLKQADFQGCASIIVLACDQNNWPIQELEHLLAATRAPVVGGIFPAIAHNSRQFEEGALLLCLPETVEVAHVTDLSDPDADYEQQLLTAVDEWRGLHEPGTLIVLVDGLASRISALVEDLFLVFGLEWPFAGGGAGSLSFAKKPCIIASDTVVADAALIIKLPRLGKIGVTHGWKTISDAMEVTESEQNVIKSLDWQPAFLAYKTLVDKHSPRPIARENFFDIAKSYPLGLQKIDGSLIVRDPLMVQHEHELLCVGAVPEGSFVRILNGDPQSLLHAAREARRLVSADDPGAPGNLLLFDCISRSLFLGSEIKQELEVLAQGEPSAGAFTLGEIANSGTDYLEFLNKTTVLVRLCRPHMNSSEGS